MRYLKKYETINNQGYIVDEPIFKNELIKIDRNFKHKLWAEIKKEKYYEIAVMVAVLTSEIPINILNDKKLREIPIIDNDKDQIQTDVYFDLFYDKNIINTKRDTSEYNQILHNLSQKEFIKYLDSKFSKRIKMMVLDSYTLGELIDKMILFKEEIIGEIPELYNQMEAEKQGNRFGI